MNISDWKRAICQLPNMKMQVVKKPNIHGRFEVGGFHEGKLASYVGEFYSLEVAQSACFVANNLLALFGEANFYRDEFLRLRALVDEMEAEGER